MSWQTAVGLLRNRALHTALVVQGLGSAATLLLGLLIAWFQGPQAQGYYGVVRSAADLLVAIALLGLPQGLVHLLNHERVRPQTLQSGLARYVCAVAVLGLVLILSCDLGVLSEDLRRPAVALPLAAGVVGWVVHALLRSFVLCMGSTSAFSWLTAAPALTLLAAAVVLLASGSHRYEWAVAASGAASALWGAALVAPLRAQSAWRQGAELQWGKLLSFGGHSTVQTVALALQPWLALSLLQRLGAAPVELGWFVLAGYVQQLFALPANFVVPLLMARASKAAGSGKPYDVTHGMRVVGVVSLLGGVAVAASLPVGVPLLLGEAYRPAVAACVCMAVAGPAVMMGRLASALMVGRGRFSPVTALFIMRVGLMATGIWLAGTGRLQLPLDRVTAAAAAWALAEIIVAACMLATTRRFRRTTA